MVGVPGKSKGCNTCRRRKKGCDLQRPICGQCRKANLHCDGYKRDTIWVNMTRETGPVRRYAPQASSSSSSSSLPPSSPTNITLADTFTRSAYHEQYLGLFWNSYLPNGRAFPPDSAQYTNGVWMNELHGFFRMDGHLALKKILLAIALAAVGKQDDKPWMIEASIKLHGSSLATLAGQLNDRNGFTSNISLATSRLMSLYEILHGNDLPDHAAQVKNWHLHLEGSLSFIVSRGPEHYTTGFAHQLFVDDRMTQISAAIVSRTRSLLDEPDWRTIPWTNRFKTPKDLLGDIFAEIPGLVLELDELRAAQDKYTKREELIGKCWRLEKEWLKWRRESAPTKDPVITEPDLVSPAHVFDSFIAAQIMASYWAVGIFLYATFHLASGSELSLIAGDPTNPRTCCRKIVEILPTFLHPYTGDYGIHGGIFPAIIVLSYLEEVDGGLDSAEAAGIYRVLGSSKNGRRIQHFVDNMCLGLKARGLRLFAPVYQ